MVWFYYVLVSPVLLPVAMTVSEHWLGVLPLQVRVQAGGLQFEVETQISVTGYA